MAKELFTKHTQKEVERLAQKAGKPLSYYERKARRLIRQMLEDEQDYLDALERSRDPNRETITLEELEKELGLDPSIR